MKSNRTIFVFGAILIWQEYRIRQLIEQLEYIGQGTVMLLEESYQKDVDEEFEEIVENLDED